MPKLSEKRNETKKGRKKNYKVIGNRGLVINNCGSYIHLCLDDKQTNKQTHPVRHQIKVEEDKWREIRNSRSFGYSHRGMMMMMMSMLRLIALQLLTRIF